MVDVALMNVGGKTLAIPEDLATHKGTRSSGRITAFKRGARAAARGRPVESCPYKANAQGAGSWHAAWVRGHQAWHAAKAGTKGGDAK